MKKKLAKLSKYLTIGAGIPAIVTIPTITVNNYVVNLNDNVLKDTIDFTEDTSSMKTGFTIRTFSYQTNKSTLPQYDKTYSTCAYNSIYQFAKTADDPSTDVEVDQNN